MSLRAFLILLVLPSAIQAAEVSVNNRHFTLPDGFTIELVAGPPLIERPITADFDELGHLYVADSSGSSDKPARQLETKPHRIVRLNASHGDGKFDQQTVFADKMMFPEGTLWFDGSLYVAAPPSIWKLTDTTGNGIADQRTEWFTGKTLTGCANDLHGPYAGPDGWIYWCKGAFAEQTHIVHGKPLVTRASHIFRARPDGSDIEPVMTGGMDNPIEIAFTPGGERIFSSTFVINPIAGKRDGLIHAIYGGIYPKIHDDVTEGHAHTFPTLMPVMTHTGPAAECALTRYEGDAFGPDYKDNLFASSFNLHKVTRHVLTPDGATFKTKDSDFVVSDNLDFHPTHLLEDADGSLLIVDTGGWYKICCPTSQLGKPDVMGAIYRVRRTDAKPVEDPRGLKLAWDTMPADQLRMLLDDPRFTIRRRTISVLAKRGSQAITALRAMTNSSATARIGAIWTATRIDAPDARAFCRDTLKDADETVRQAAGHSVSIWRDKDAIPALLELLTNASLQNRRVAAEALGRIGDGGIVTSLFHALAQPLDHSLEHSLTYALIEIGNSGATRPGLVSDNPHVQRAAMMALDQMDGPTTLDPKTVAEAFSSTNPDLRETAAWIAARHPEWGDSMAEAIKSRLTTQFKEEDQHLLSHQLAKLSQSPAIQKLIVDQLSAPQTQIAFDAMADSGLNPLPPSWATALSAALTDPARVVAAAAVVRKLPPESAAPLADALLHAAEQSDFPPQARLNALLAAPPGTVSPDLFTFLRTEIQPTQPAAVRSLAADVLARSALSTEQLTALTDLLRSASPLEINKLLHAYAKSKDESIGLKLVAALKESKSLRSLRADVLKPRLNQFGPKVAAESQVLLAKLDPDAAEQKSKLDHLLATLPTGDVRRGQIIFNSPKVSCVSCHAIGYLGGHVGPDLTKVGTIRSERDLLESIIYPSASFAQSFEPYIAITTGGQRYDGLLRRDDAEGIMVVTGPDQEVKIPRAELKELRPGTLSIMPAGLDQQLSPQELSDLLAFLKATKW